MTRFIEVAKMAQIPEGGTIAVEVEGITLALVKLQATSTRSRHCPDEAGPCPKGRSWRGDRVSVAPVLIQHQDGSQSPAPPRENVTTYRVRIAGDAVGVKSRKRPARYPPCFDDPTSATACVMRSFTFQQHA